MKNTTALQRVCILHENLANPEMHLTTYAYNVSMIQSSSKTHDVT